MPNSKNNNSNWLIIRQILMVVLILAFIFSVWWLAIGVRNTYRTGLFQPVRHGKSLINIFNQPLSPNEIQLWMTFDYLNKVFKLPADYLKNSLSINDQHYPNLQLQHYARRNNINIQTFLNLVRRSILNYQAK